MTQIEKLEKYPYYPIALFYRRRFGSKVYKVSVNLVSTCPNREGIRGMKTCNFCDVYGSAANPEVRNETMSDQIVKIRGKMKDVYGAENFLVYFQSYTSTFTKTQNLRQAFEVAKKFEDVKGFVIGTRPDCLSNAVFDLWNEYIERGFFVSVELGVQSFDEEQLIWMRRGHTAEQSIQAIYKIREKCPGIDIGIHLMFGLKAETDDQVLKAAKFSSELPIDNVKLHNLHVLKNTALEQEYRSGEFVPINFEDYSRRVGLYLMNLRSDLPVHRLTAVASHHDDLLAPEWVSHKMRSYQEMLNYLKNQKIRQGMSLNSDAFLVN